MELLVVRHARPQRVEGIDGGADPELTELGHQQAEAVADALMYWEIDHIVSSPMVRARQTAAPLAERLGMEPEIVDHLIESDHESGDYIPIEELKQNDPEAYRELGNDLDQFFGSDGREVFTNNVVGAFDALINAHGGKRLAVFCHGMVTAVFLADILGVDSPFELSPDYTGVSRIQASAKVGKRSIRSFNETQHLSHLPDTRM